MSGDPANTSSAPRADSPGDRLPGNKSSRSAAAHGSVALPGCMVHSDLSVGALDWVCRALRCEEGIDRPSRADFDGFHATLRVQTFDDIDICVKIATTALALSPIAAIGLRELVVNAVEHGNLEITFDEKSELLANGGWQAEIERRLGFKALRDRFTIVELRLLGNTFEINIIDQGQGFDWSRYIDPATAPTDALHGRGMALALDAGFRNIEYRGTGNEVAVRGNCDRLLA